MAKKQINNKKLSAILKCLILFIIGILFIFNIASKVFSLILGIGLIIAGLAILISEYKEYKTFLTSGSTAGLIAVSVGIYAIVTDIITLLISIVPYILVVFGVAYLLDGIINFVNLKRSGTTALIKLILGIISLVLGLLLLFVPQFKDFVNFIIGGVLIGEAILVLFDEVFKK